MAPGRPDPHSSRGLVLAFLRRRPHTAGELAEAIGISPQAVRDQLRSLEAEGLIRIDAMRRDTGGKPAREYSLTAAGEESFQKAYGALLRNLVTELHRLGGDTEREILRRVGRRTASQALGGRLPEAADPGDLARPELRRRLETAVGIVNSLGGAAEVEESDGALRIRGHGCPLSAVVGEHPEACVLAEALVEALSGIEVAEACERTGRPRCAFDVLFRAEEAAL